MRRVLVFAVLIALVAIACGDADEPAATSSTTMEMSDMDDMDGSDDMDGMDDMAGMNMGDASAVRADQVTSADLSAATFVLLDTRPPGYDDFAGDAWLARHDMGTTVTLELTGLVPGVSYIAHLHEGGCDDAGGDHFKFDPNGSDMPPNEIHLAFEAGEDGSGFMTAENHGIVGDNARSVVVHPADLLDNKLACADF